MKQNTIMAVLRKGKRKAYSNFKVSKKSKTFWASALVEAGAGLDTYSCVPPTLEIPYYKWEGSLFTSGLLHNFTLVKVEEVCLTGWTCKMLFFLLKNCNVIVKIRDGIIVAVNKLTV